MENKMSLTIFLFLLITAVIKDVIEIFLGFIPGINLFVWIIVLPLVIYIFVITLISGIRGTWIFIGQALDLIPFASILPIATVTVILVYVFQKSPAPVKKTIKTVTKLTAVTSPKIKTKSTPVTSPKIKI